LSHLGIGSFPELAALRSDVERTCEIHLEPLVARIESVERNFSHLQSGSEPKIPKSSTFPPREAKSVNGITSYLSRKHGGNIHDSGLVTIASKTIYTDDPDYARRNVAELTSGTGFWSRDRPDQWVSWDFHEMRVSPTHLFHRWRELGRD
jgi:hypothetical protein